MMFFIVLVIFVNFGMCNSVADHVSDNKLVWKFRPTLYCDEGKECPNFYYGSEKKDIGIVLKYIRVSEINSTGQVAETLGVKREINKLPEDFVILQTETSSGSGHVYNVMFNGTLKGICEEAIVPGCNLTQFASQNWYVASGVGNVNGVSLKEGNIKMSFYINYWPFLADSTSLRVSFEIKGINLKSPVKFSGSGKKISISEDRGEVTIDFGGECKVDGTDESTVVTWENEIETNQRVLVHVTFVKGSKIEYDPTFTFLSSDIVIKVSFVLWVLVFFSFW